MSKYQWISILGLWVIVFLFLGFPSSWDKIIAVISGLVIIAIAYRIGAEVRIPQKPSQTNSASAQAPVSAPSPVPMENTRQPSDAASDIK